MTNLTEEFLSGFNCGGDCFAPGNPHISTSPAHMAFEAGRYFSFSWRPEDIKSAHMSRGYSVRVELLTGERVIIKIDYDHKAVSRA